MTEGAAQPWDAHLKNAVNCLNGEVARLEGELAAAREIAADTRRQLEEAQHRIAELEARPGRANNRGAMRE